MSAEQTVLSRLFAVITMALAIAALYFGKQIVFPIMLAILLSFVLTPVVVRLQRMGLGRVPSVLLATSIAIAATLCLGWVVMKQLVELSGNLADYRENLIAKVHDLGSSARGPWQKATKTLQDIQTELTEANKDTKDTKDTKVKAEKPSWMPWANLLHPSEEKGDGEALPVKVVALESPLAQVKTWLGPLIAPITTAGMVTILVIFMLLQREEFRNRFVQLCGTANLRATTQALNEATSRVSRYLRLALILNAGYGLFAGIGLYFIGVPNAILWGVLAFLLRFLPYVGPWIAAAMPIALSLAVFSGWTQPLLVIGVFVALEIIVNNILEPWLYGSQVGLSSVGVILAAIFWTWIWGPIGLIVAVPLTVCLVVAGQYVHQLRFITILLGDQSSLSSEKRVYQRLLALDEEEAQQVVLEYRSNHSLTELYDNVLVPALIMGERDRHAGLLNAEEEEFITSGARELVAENEDEITSQRSTLSDGELKAHVLCIPAGDEADETAAQMIGQLLKAQGCEITYSSQKLLTSEVVDRIQQEGYDIALISALPPLTTRNGRYLCKRLRQSYPDLPIIVGLWRGAELEKTKNRFLGDGASQIVTSMADAVKQIHSLAVQLSYAKEAQAEASEKELIAPR